MNKIISFKVQDNFQNWLQFQDGESKVIDFTTLLGKGISASLLDKDNFYQVSIGYGGGLEWPNGMDFCPNFLKDYTLDLVVQS
jgi:hypothetical protein